MTKARRMLRGGLAAVTVASLTTAAGFVISDAALASATWVATATTNIRATPDAAGTVLSTLNVGDTVTATAHPKGEWLSVTIAGQNGFVAKSYVKKAVSVQAEKLTPRTTRTALANVNVRIGPAAHYKSVAIAPADTKIETTGRISGGYAEVRYANDLAWVDNAQLSATAAPLANVTTPSAKPTITIPHASSQPTPAPPPAKPTPAATPPTTDPAPATPTPPPPAKIVIKTQMRTTTGVNVRTGPGTNFTIITEAPEGTVVGVTGRVVNNYAEIDWQGEARWLYTDYLAPLTTGLPSPFAPSITSKTLDPADQAERAAKAVAYAKAQLGKKYVWGATGPDAYDCSGLTYAAWLSTGYRIPRIAYNQGYTSGFKRVSDAELRPGDLIIENGGSHVIMYIGDGKIIEAPNRSNPIRIMNLSQRSKNHIAVRPGA